jgi:hypothetical protein
LVIDGRYAIRPHPDRAELYLPFERVAWQWFLDTVYAAERPAQWMAEQVARLAVRAGVAAAVAPYHAVVAHRPPRPSSPVAARAASAVDCHAPLAALVTDSGNRAVSIGFGSGFGTDGEGAVLVTKLPKRPEFSGRTEHEQDVTQRIRAALGADAAEVLPRPLGTLKLGEITASIESAVPGASMFRTSARWGRSMRHRRLDLDRAMDWIAVMHRDHRLRDDTWSRARQTEELDEPVRQYIAHFGVTPEETALFDAAIAAATALRDKPLPVVWQHRDYSPSNVHAVDGTGTGSVRVLDWEGAQPGIPVADAWRFAMTWHQAVCGRATSARRAAGIAALLANTGARRDRRAAKAARRALARYMETVGVDPAFQPVLVVASAVEHALRRLQQQRDAGVAADAAPATLRGGNVHGELVEQIAQHASSLFGATGSRP